MTTKAACALLIALAVLAVSTPAWADRVRLRGIAASDRGPTVLFIVRLNLNTFTGAGQGKFRCRPGSARCLFPQGRLAVQFFSDGSFDGQVLSGRGSCAVSGSLAGAGVVGRYACLSRRGNDTGGFALSPF